MRLRTLVEIILSAPRVLLSGCRKARFAGNSGAIAKKRNAAAAAQEQPNVKIISTRVLSPGLRGRFLLATLSLAIILVGGFALIMAAVIEIVEYELIQKEFESYFAEVVQVWLAAPDKAPAVRSDFTVYLVNDGDFSQVPLALRALGAGSHLEFSLNGREYSVGRHDLADASLFVLADSDLDPVERTEDQLLRIALVFGFLALLLATAVALWLARVVLQPVHALAQSTNAIEPGQPRKRLFDERADNEVGLIARAFDRTLDRFDEMVERERAFTHDASHELRTPLAVILTGIELMVSAADLPEPQRARLERIRSAAEQMRTLTDGLLFLARPPGEIPDETIEVGEVVREAMRIQRLANPMRIKEIRLHIEQGQTLAAPRGLLLCVVNNLLRNALEHADDRGVDVTLSANLVQVVDLGLGIDSELGSNIFERHVRGPSSSGEGLGLNIVKRICDRLGWRISVDSETGSGTHFSLHLG